MSNEAILTTLIMATSSVLVAYLTAKYKSNNKPKDKGRIDFAFDAYERIIKQLQDENERLRQERKE